MTFNVLDFIWSMTLASLLFPSCGEVQAGEGAIELKEGPGKIKVLINCAVCHSLDYVQMNSPILDRAGWEKAVGKMVGLGAEISDADKQEILDYLSSHYGK